MPLSGARADTLDPPKRLQPCGKAPSPRIPPGAANIRPVRTPMTRAVSPLPGARNQAALQHPLLGPAPHPESQGPLVQEASSQVKATSPGGTPQEGALGRPPLGAVEGESKPRPREEIQVPSVPARGRCVRLHGQACRLRSLQLPGHADEGRPFAVRHSAHRLDPTRIGPLLDKHSKALLLGRFAGDLLPEIGPLEAGQQGQAHLGPGHLPKGETHPTPNEPPCVGPHRVSRSRWGG